MPSDDPSIVPVPPHLHQLSPLIMAEHRLSLQRLHVYAGGGRGGPATARVGGNGQLGEEVVGLSVAGFENAGGAETVDEEVETAFVGRGRGEEVEELETAGLRWGKGEGQFGWRGRGRRGERRTSVK